MIKREGGARARPGNRMRREENAMGKRLYRSSGNRMLAGVCGGIAEYFGIDATLVRLGWVLFCALGGSGVLAYIIAAIIVPEDTGM